MPTPVRVQVAGLPLVSKRWARILKQPSEAWQHSDIDISSLLSRITAEDGMARVCCVSVPWWLGSAAGPTASGRWSWATLIELKPFRW